MSSTDQYKLGLAYKNGSDTPKDLDKAAYYFDLAADKGHYVAQYELGLINLANGNLIEGYKWLDISAQAGHEPAKNKLFFYEEKMSPENLQEAQKLIRIWKASKR